MSFKFCCISRCGLTSKDVILHTFPNPANEPDRFKEWVSYCGASLQGMDDTYIFMNRRICRLHFERKFHYRNNRLCKLAVPTLLGASLHRFPNPDKFPEQFKAWVCVMGGILEGPEDHVQYKNKRICDIHFKMQHRNRNNRLSCLAVPSLHLPSAVLHGFPDPSINWARFNVWVTNAGLHGEDQSYVFKNRRICRLHFEERYYSGKNRLTRSAFPTLHLPNAVLSEYVDNPVNVIYVDQAIPSTSEKSCCVDELSADRLQSYRKVHSKTINCEEDKEDSSTIPDPIKAENFLLKSELNSFETQSQSNETIVDDNFYTMDQNKFADDFDDPIVLSTEEKENEHDKDVEFGLELSSKKDPDTMTHSDFKCNVCCGDIIGFRYTCLQCVDWDMCASCEARGEHPEHYVLRLPAPRPHAECEPIIAAIRQQIENLLLLSKEITSEIYFKEEPDVDSILEEFDTDLTDPFSATSDRNVPKMDLRRLQRATHVTITDPEQERPTDASACRVDEPSSLAPGTQRVLKSSSIPDTPGKRGYILRAISATNSVKQYQRNHKSKIRIIEMSTNR